MVYYIKKFEVKISIRSKTMPKNKNKTVHLTSNCTETLLRQKLPILTRKFSLTFFYWKFSE